MKILEILKKNFYLAGVCVFLLWIVLFDSNDLISQIKNYSSYKNLENTKEYYVDKIDVIQNDLKSLRTNPKELERFAREKYLMKKEGEDVFLIEVEESE